MAGFFIDFIIVAVLIIGITATNGVILNGIGTKIFGGKKVLQFVHQSDRMQTGWKMLVEKDDLNNEIVFLYT